MSTITELWVERENLRNTKIIEKEAHDLEAGEIRLEIDKFALTSNNVTYATSGDLIGYWKFYPADEEWGVVPVWGLANVVESRSDEIGVGERLYGFMPMSNQTILRPGSVRETTFMDATPHRSTLPALYNQYRRVNFEPEALRRLEDERCVFLPLFATSYVLYDYLLDNGFFGANQIIIGSASSKTGFGLAKLLKADPNAPEIIGITSARNVAFVHGLACYHTVITYDKVASLDAANAVAYIDMSGNSELTHNLHHHFGENLVESCMVGITHWEKAGPLNDLPGAKPTLFFAPAQISKRDKEWGRGVIFEKAHLATSQISKDVSNHIRFEHISGAETASDLWRDMLDNKVSPARGLLISFA